MILRFSGTIHGGYPSPAQGYEDESLDLHAMLVPHPAATFFYRVRGNDLLKDGLRDGTILVVDRSVTPTPGRLIVADDRGERVVMRLEHERKDELMVWGVVTAAVVRF